MASGFLRIAGTLYALLGIALGALAIHAIAIDPEGYYEPPYACAHLECFHDLARSPHGRLHCSAFPPRDIKHAGVPAAIKTVRSAAGLICARAALACCLAIIFWGSQLSLGLQVSITRCLRHPAVHCLIPVAAFSLNMAAVWLKAVYGFVPR
jgi:hypothetical protein